MRLFVFVLALIAAPAFADEVSDAIDVGRFGVMLDQAAAIEKVRLPVDDTQPSTYGQLVATVVRFNTLSAKVCRKRRRLPAEDCAGPFTPGWLVPSQGEVEPARLRPMIDEAGSRIGTFWGDVCDRAPDRHFCDIE